VETSRTGGTRAALRVGGMVALSLALHGAAAASMAQLRRPPARERIEIEVVRREPPRPPPQALPAPSPKAPPARAASRQVALAKPPPPPPALASAPPQPEPAARPIPRVGLSLGSTVSTGGFAVGVGNTLHGKAEETAADPAAVPPYTVAAARLSAQPRPIDLPRIAYPPGARKAGTEGRVLLVLGIDAQGKVTSVRVLEAPSPSLAEAALEGARKFRFAPALLEGAPVATEIRFTYTFLLE
jgi:periplasmic protein TonB